MFRPVLASSSVPGGPLGSGSLFYFIFERSGFGLVPVFIYFKCGTCFWFFKLEEPFRFWFFLYFQVRLISVLS
jgi:hypothetical protein